MAAVTTLIRHLLLRRLRLFGRAIRLGIGLLCRLRRRNECGRFRLRRRRLYPLIPRRQTRGFIESRALALTISAANRRASWRFLLGRYAA